ncbi:MAG: DUF1707 domain-containing protein [Actinobacteria bacterium]|nr:MAG: DUF1707 domain-containing protein [Actinomycetota bacterium]
MPYDLVRLMARSQIRASDAERERAVETLRHCYADGRISDSELEERVERAYAARTRGELDALFADLPMQRARRHARAMGKMNRAALRAHASTYALVNGGLIGVWAATGAGPFWPGWPMGWWGAFLGWHWFTSRVVGRALGDRRRAQARRHHHSRALPR